MKIGTPGYNNGSNSKKSSSYKNLDNDGGKRIIPDGGHSKDMRKYMINEKEYISSEREYKQEGLSKNQSKGEMIQEGFDNYFGVDDNINPEDFIIIVNGVAVNVLEYEESKDLLIDSFNAGKFGILAVSDNIGINQKKKDIRFFELLNRNGELFLLDPNYKLSYKSLLKVKLSNGESETIPSSVFLKYLGESSASSKIEFAFDYVIKKYNINWDNNSATKKYSDINYFGGSTRYAA